MGLGLRVGGGESFRPLGTFADLGGCSLAARCDLGLVASGMTSLYSPQGAATIATQVVLTGTPDETLRELVLTVTTTGDRSTMRFSVSLDGGATTPYTDQAADGSGNYAIAGINVFFNPATYTSGQSAAAFPEGISTWNDLSGSAHHLAVVNAKPGRNKLASSLVRGRAPVGFLGNSTLTSGLRAAYTQTLPYTLLFVARRRGSSTSFIWFAGASSNLLLVQESGASQLTFNVGASMNVATDLSAFAFYELTVRASSSEVRMNGVLVGSAGSISASQPTGLTVGRSGTGTANCSFLDVAEVAMRPGVLSTIERVRVADYVRREHRLAVVG